MAAQAFTGGPQSLPRKLYRSRWLVFELVSRDLRLRYRGSVLGFAWSLLNPLLFMAVYVLVFGQYLRLGFHNYALFLLSGILPFNWFSSAIQQGTTSILDGRMYVGKTVFPAEVLIAVPVLSNFINFLLSLPILLLADLFFGQSLGTSFLLLPLLILLQLLINTGALLFFAAFNVFYRDFQQLVIYIVMALFYLIPIFYRIQDVPAEYRNFVLANPLAQLIICYQDVLFYNKLPGYSALGYVCIFAVLLFLAGFTYFGRYKELFGEYV